MADDGCPHHHAETGDHCRRCGSWSDTPFEHGRNGALCAHCYRLLRTSQPPAFYLTAQLRRADDDFSDTRVEIALTDRDLELRVEAFAARYLYPALSSLGIGAKSKP